MRHLQSWVETPLAGAVGWAVLHSLWEGAIISALLAAGLAVMKSARVRYLAACVALLAMVIGFAFTLFWVMPEGVYSLGSLSTPVFPAWNVRTNPDAQMLSSPDLSELVPWLAPFWVTGVWIFYLKHLAGWISVSRLRRRGV